jgi:uncharacterized membrane protein YtjA (UPF0391 family)
LSKQSLAFVCPPDPLAKGKQVKERACQNIPAHDICVTQTARDDRCLDPVYRTAERQPRRGHCIGQRSPTAIGVVPASTPEPLSRMVVVEIFIAAKPKKVAKPEGILMLHYAIVFLVIALIAALFGFGGIAAGAAGIAKILFVIFLICAVVALLVGPRRI